MPFDLTVFIGATKLEETGLLLGVRPNEPYAENEFSFEIGDRLLLYTDGLLQAENARGQSFGDAVLPTFIQEKQGLGTEQFADLQRSVNQQPFAKRSARMVA